MSILESGSFQCKSITAEIDHFEKKKKEVKDERDIIYD